MLQPAFSSGGLTILLRMTVLGANKLRGQGNDGVLTGADNHRRDDLMRVADLAVLIDRVGVKILYPIQSHQQLSVEHPPGFELTAPIQLCHDRIKYPEQR